MEWLPPTSGKIQPTSGSSDWDPHMMYSTSPRPTRTGLMASPPGDSINTVNVDIFAKLNFRASSPLIHIRAVKCPLIHIRAVKFRGNALYFYLFYYNHTFHSHLILAH